LRVLRKVAAVPVQRPDVKPVKTRAHLRWLVKYLLEQVIHHNIDVHPALWSGSCFQDLVGARMVDGLQLCTFEALPRLALAEVCKRVGVTKVQIAPASDQQIRRAGPFRLVSAVSSVLALDLQLKGKTRPVVLGRRTVVKIAQLVGMNLMEVAWALCITDRAVRKISKLPVEQSIVRAARIRLSLEDVVAAPKESTSLSSASMSR